MAFESIQFEPDHAHDQCPYCDAPITRAKLVAIHTRIRDEETQKFNQYRLTLDEQYQRERDTFQKTATEKANEHADARIAEAANERDAALQKAAQIQAGAAEAERLAIERTLLQARSAWETEVARTLDERAADETRARASLQVQIDTLNASKNETESKLIALDRERNAALIAAANAREGIEAEIQAAIAKIRIEQDQALADQTAKLKEAAEREAQLVKERDEASQQAEARAAQLKEEREEAARRTEAAALEADKAREMLVETKVAEVREILKNDYERDSAEKAAEAARAQESLLKKLADVQRQLENKTASELGEAAEINLFDRLRDAFPDDRITRIVKGEPGADIRIDVSYKGAVAGAILIDSKNRKGWQASFATKLHADQVEAEADYAILSSTAFPKDKKVLCVVADVIVAQPAHVCELVGILREQIVKLHIRGLSNERRAEKRESVYRLITSEQFRQTLAEGDRIREQLEKLDVEERNEHSRTWDKRGRLLRRQHQALSNVTVEIDAIVEGDDSAEGGQ